MTRAPQQDDGALQPFERVRAYVDAKQGGDPNFADVVALAEITADSMQAFFATINVSVYRELREIADYITTMRSEIALLRAGELKESRLPSAGQHLGAIVVATEEATNRIMECAEAMLAGADKDDAAYKALVSDKAMEIFEACSFQDLTGQRIARVIETLEHIEQRVGRFAAAVNPGGEPGEVAEDAREVRARELMLNGPQAAGSGIDQNDIDALMANG